MEQNIQLEKKLSPVNVWSLALGCIIGWGAFVMPGNTFLIQAGPLGTAIAMGIAAVIMIVIAFNYHFMINKYPVAGGEFTYTQKAFGERHAFVCSWFLGLSYLAIVPLNATALALIGRNLMNNIFQVGFHYSVAGYDIYLGEILLAEAALVLFAWLSIRGVRFAGVFQTGLVFALVGGVLIVTAAALVSPRASFANLQPAFTPGKPPLGGVLAVVAVAPWAFVGFDTIPQAAEEFRFSPRMTRVIMVLSILFGAAVYVILNTVTAMVVPEGYATWADYIQDLPNLDGVLSLPTFHAGQQLLGNWGLLFLGLAVLGAILSGIIGFYIATSRLLFSMSRDRVLPAWFGRVDPKYGTPKNAMIFCIAVSMSGPILGREALGWFVDMSAIGASIGYLFTCASTLITARRDGDGSPFLKVMAAVGVCFSVAFIILQLVPIPGLSGVHFGKESYMMLIAWSAMGLVFYAAQWKHFRSGN